MLTQDELKEAARLLGYSSVSWDEARGFYVNQRSEFVSATDETLRAGIEFHTEIEARRKVEGR